MNLRHLWQMARWARHPPSAGRVTLVLVVIAVCVGIVVLERLAGFPDGLVPQRLPR
ncbi:MAG: hypothetical protein MUF73_14905 [Rhodobacteraceae bacterium]|jgi:hypothetical protein|nr:hypothetical protein [Paracoccaceae bacterium]